MKPCCPTPFQATQRTLLLLVSKHCDSGWRVEVGVWIDREQSLSYARNPQAMEIETAEIFRIGTYSPGTSAGFAMPDKPS